MGDLLETVDQKAILSPLDIYSAYNNFGTRLTNTVNEHIPCDVPIG